MIRNHFWRSVASVLTGSALAQFVPIVGSIVIARLYAPAEFGLFSAWLGIVMLLGVILSGRFETALAIEPDGEPRRFGMLSTLVTIGMTSALSALMLLLAFWLFPQGFFRLSPVMLMSLIPAGLLLAVAQAWQSWAAAEGKYRQLSIMRIVQASTSTLAQILAGLYYASADALAVAYAWGIAVGIAQAAWIMPVGYLPRGRAKGVIREFWHRHRRLPLFSLPADSINSAAAQLPVLLIAARFGAEVAGLLAMTLRILGAPIGLLGKSVLDVFKRQAALSYRARGECRAEYIQTFKVLSLFSLIFGVALVFTSEHIFAWAFGEVWRESGVMAIWLLPLFALRFVASPLSYMTYIAEKQHVDLLWQISLLGVTYYCLSFLNDYKTALLAYSSAYSLLYIVYLWMSYRFSFGASNA